MGHQKTTRRQSLKWNKWCQPQDFVPLININCSELSLIFVFLSWFFCCFAVLILKLINIYLGTLQLGHFIYLLSSRFVADRNWEVKSCSLVYMHLTRGVYFIKTNFKKNVLYMKFAFCRKKDETSNLFENVLHNLSIRDPCISFTCSSSVIRYCSSNLRSATFSGSKVLLVWSFLLTRRFLATEQTTSKNSFFVFLSLTTGRRLSSMRGRQIVLQL